MVQEDLTCQIVYKTEKTEALAAELGQRADEEEAHQEEVEELGSKVKAAKKQVGQLTEALNVGEEKIAALEAQLAEKQIAVSDKNDSPIKIPDAEKADVEDANIQTDIGMDYFDREASVQESKNSQMSGAASHVSKSKSGQLTKQRSRISRDSSLKDNMQNLNHDSSTAVGTLQHGQSKPIDHLDVAGLKHNQSLDQGENVQSAGLRSGIAKEVIEEGEEEDQDDQDQDSSKVKRSKLPPVDKDKGYPSVMSGQGMRSGRTLREMSGSEMGTSSAQSPSYKSLMKSKQNQPNDTFHEQLKQSQQ